jgi:hypothetical protein|tara:strand:- start:211 stop:486 length:276 start_codon:yes stop_codon:yes gene_type:complete
MNKKRKKEYFEFLINEYDKGNAKIRGEHPEEVKTAVDTFFKAGKILVDNPDIGTMPQEYVHKLLEALAQHPQYHALLIDLVGIIQDGEGDG